jgi:hypothetical protein
VKPVDWNDCPNCASAMKPATLNPKTVYHSHGGGWIDAFECGGELEICDSCNSVAVTLGNCDPDGVSINGSLVWREGHVQ